jgi:AAA-ATPase Vps4-associated protein 1
LEDRSINLISASKSGSCFVCYKESSAVLTNEKDFFYVCIGHILDYSFCKHQVSPPPKPTTPEPKPKPVEEKNVADKSIKDGGEKDKIDGEKKETTKDPKAGSNNAKGGPITADPKEFKEVKEVKPEPVKPGPGQKFVLTSNIFYLRENNLKKKQEAKLAKQISFPSVPTKPLPK